MSASRPVVYVAAKYSQFQKHVRDRKDARAIELLAHHDPVVARWRRADEAHRRSLELVLERLTRLGADVKMIAKPHAKFEPRGAALVVTVGGDGTLLAASHHVRFEPLLGVNSSPEHSVGYFCAAQPSNLKTMLARALEGTLAAAKLTRMSVTVNGRLRSNRVLNEVLFSHRIPAAVSRYILQYRGTIEEQRSSGCWIGTAAGSTGALHSAGGRKLQLGSRKLQLVVREPYVIAGSELHLRKVIIPYGETLTVRTKMDRAVLFLDGPYRRIHVRLGDVVGFTASDEQLSVLGVCGPR